MFCSWQKKKRETKKNKNPQCSFCFTLLVWNCCSMFLPKQQGRAESVVKLCCPKRTRRSTFIKKWFFLVNMSIKWFSIDFNPTGCYCCCGENNISQDRPHPLPIYVKCVLHCRSQDQPRPRHYLDLRASRSRQSVKRTAAGFFSVIICHRSAGWVSNGLDQKSRVRVKMPPSPRQDP